MSQQQHHHHHSPPPPITFIDLDRRIIEALTDAFDDLAPCVTCSVANVRDMAVTPGTMYMSPANSLGFMDGGVDATYMAMFPGVQRDVQAKIRSLGKTTALGRHYLPVGSAVVVPVGPCGCTLVSAPTMFLPHDVSSTRNAYHAMMAALMAFRKQGKVATRLVATGLCCGYGRMAPVVSARQIREAYDDFVRGGAPAEVDEQHASDPTIVLTQDHDDEQPANFDNREIQERTIVF